MGDLTSITSLSTIEYGSAVILANIILSFFLSVFIAIVYQKTHRGISYSQSFVISLVMIGVLSTIAMMILGNNFIRALGILGVFTLLRFRTIIKDTKDASYLFFSLATGMAVGTSNYVIAIMSTVLLSLIVYILHKINFGSVVREGFMFTFIADSNFDEKIYERIFKDKLSSFKLLQIKAQSSGEQEYYFSIRFKKDTNKGEFLKDFKTNPGVVFADLSTSRDSAEY